MDVSVIIPVYKPSLELLLRCLKSVLVEKDLDIEVLLVDDGGETEYWDVWATVKEFDARVKVIHQKHAGVSAARNLGIKESKGQYLTFVDYDDAVADGWLKYSLEQAKKGGLDVIYGNVINGTQEGEMKKPTNGSPVRETYFYNENLWKVHSDLLNYRSMYSQGIVTLNHGPYGKLYRRELVAHIPFPEELKISEDQVFVHRAQQKSKKVMVTSRTAYYYIYNGDSATHRAREDAVQSMMEALELVQSLLPDVSQLKQVFSERVMFDLWIAFVMEHFQGNDLKSIPLLLKEWGKVCEGSLPRMARSNVSIVHLDCSKSGMRIWMICHFVVGLMLLRKIATMIRHLRRYG